jgi:hypothetical protein
MSQYSTVTYESQHKVGFWRSLVHSITGCRYHYQIDLVYYYERDEDGCFLNDKFYSRTTQIGVIDPKALDYEQRRTLHKMLFPKFIERIKGYKGGHLKGGQTNSVRIENIQYLGFY